jgi:asparagine synthase (glutamine-hydrolysing)
MCGIAGIFNRDGTPVDRVALAVMTSALRHRGPDGEGLWTEGNVGLGHRRLAIRGLGPAGHQPMADASGRVVVSYNGEIYNDGILRRELERLGPGQLTGACDTEVLPAGWIAWGENLPRRLEGMFAFALWDRKARRLGLARDPVGIKPLYYSMVGASLRFASEIKALLTLADQPRELDAQALHAHLAQGFPGTERTLLSGVRSVPPGSMLIADDAGIRIVRWWRPVREPRIRRIDEAVEGFLTLWRQVVGDMQVSDVPVGLLLSGGIDSALVAMETGRGARMDRPAFTARFSDRGHDESPVAARIARAAGLPHQTLAIDEQSGLEGVFERIVCHADGQLADSSSLALFLICEQARRSVPVLLSGDGADEFFGGYETYRATRIASLLGSVVPRPLARAGAAWLRRRGGRDRGAVSAREKLERLLAGIAAAGGGAMHAQWRRHLPTDLMPGLYGPAMRGLAGTDPLADYAGAMLTGGSLVDRCLVADQAHYLPGDMLVKADRMSMAHGLELRVPFLDRRIMEFAGSLDADLLTPMGGPDKLVLRRALATYPAPADVAALPKHGFNIPVAAFLRGPLRPMAERLLDRDAGLLSPHFDPDGVRRLWRLHRDGEANLGHLIWNLAALAKWVETL